MLIEDFTSKVSFSAFHIYVQQNSLISMGIINNLFVELATSSSDDISLFIVSINSFLLKTI